MFKKLLFTFGIFFLAVFAFACGGEQQEEPEKDPTEDVGGEGEKDPNEGEEGEKDPNKGEETEDNAALTQAITSKLKEYVKGFEDLVYEDFEKSFVVEEKEVSLEYEFEKVIAKDGKITAPEFDEELTGKVTAKYQEIAVTENLTVTVAGTFLDKVADEFMKQFGDKLDASLRVKTEFDYYGGCKVVWESGNTDILTKTGTFNRPFHDTEMVITFLVRSTEPKVKHNYERVLKVAGQDISYKTEFVREWVLENFATNGILTQDIELVTEVPDYEATIKWLDKDQKPITDLSKLVQNPVLGLGYDLNLEITIHGKSHIEQIFYRVWDKEYVASWDTIELFLQAINDAAFGSYVMRMVGYETPHYGFVHFYKPGKASVNTDYMTEYTYGKVNTGIKKTSTEYVVVHDTAGGAPTHTADSFAIGQVNKNNDSKNTEYISWHYTAGDDAIYQSLPLDEVAYHAGDGSHVFGDIWYSSTYKKADCIGGGNRNGIGIETCVNQGSNYNKTLKDLSKLIATELFPQFENLNLGRVKQHHHFSGKDCPMVIRHCIGWDKFMSMVAIENFGFEILNDVEWETLTPNYLDENGYVTKDATGKELSYKVKVTFNGETKEFTYKFTPGVIEYEKVITHF